MRGSLSYFYHRVQIMQNSLKKVFFFYIKWVCLGSDWAFLMRCWGALCNIRGLIWNSQHRPGALWLLKSSWQLWNTEICLRAQTASSIIKIVLTKYTNVHIITRTFVSHHIMFTRSKLNNFLCQGRSESIEPPFVCLWKSSTNNSRGKIVFNDILKSSQWWIMIWSILVMYQIPQARCSSKNQLLCQLVFSVVPDCVPDSSWERW